MAPRARSSTLEEDPATDAPDEDTGTEESDEAEEAATTEGGGGDEAEEAEHPAGDVANLSDEHYEGEVGPVILPGYWVVLGQAEGVEDRYVGSLAIILDGPWTPAYLGEKDQPIAGYSFDADKKYLVQTRDDANATFEVGDDAFVKTGQGRSDVLPVG